MIKYIIKAYTKCGGYVQITSPNNDVNDSLIIKKLFRHEKLCPYCAKKRKQLEEERKRNTITRVSTKTQCGKEIFTERSYTEDKSIIE